MSRKKVFLLVTLSEMGGAQKVVGHLAARIDRKIFDVTVACSPGGELVNWVRNIGDVQIVELPCLKRDISPVADFLCLIRLYRLIKSGGYDIVHCHSSKAGVLGRLAARLAGVPRIYFTVHGWGIDDRQPLPVRWMYIMAERLAGAVSSRIVCVSDYDRNKGLALRLASAEKLVVIHNGMPDAGGPRRESGEKLRAELGLETDVLIIGTVMRLAPPKEPLFFLEMAARLLDEGQEGLYFVVVGDGPLRPRCEDYIDKHSLGGKVFLLGAREDAAQLVRGFDVFTLFSRHEGLPLTIIEAMMAGVPVVASNAGGVGEMVLHGETGYLVNGFNPDTAAEYIEELVSSPELRTKIGENGRMMALENFTLGMMVNQYNALYCGRL